VSYRTVLQDDGKGEAERVAQVPFLRSLPWDNCEAVDISTLPYPGFRPICRRNS
jgi:hypothetical protein